MVAEKRPDVILVKRSFIIHVNEGKFLALQRSSKDCHHPNLWEVPGGKAKKGQNLEEALECEIAEETGLLIQPIDTITHFNNYTIKDTGPYNGMLYVALFGLSTFIGGQLKLSHEHMAAKWCTFDGFLALDLTPETRKASLALEQRLRDNNVV